MLELPDANLMILSRYQDIQQLLRSLVVKALDAGRVEAIRERIRFEQMMC